MFYIFVSRLELDPVAVLDLDLGPLLVQIGHSADLGLVQEYYYYYY